MNTISTAYPRMPSIGIIRPAYLTGSRSRVTPHKVSFHSFFRCTQLLEKRKDFFTLSSLGSALEMRGMIIHVLRAYPSGPKVALRIYTLRGDDSHSYAELGFLGGYERFRIPTAVLLALAIRLFTT
jgi:hypothetical protein